MSRTDDAKIEVGAETLDEVRRMVERALSLVERLADAVLAQNAAVGIHARSIDRLLLQLQAVTNAQTESTNAQYEVRLGIQRIGERLAILSKDVDDVERATREATGSFALSVRDPEKHVAVGVIEAFGKLPRWSQSLIVAGIFSTMIGLLLWKVLGR
jgi:hypothetical protein